ncbi:MAG: hypothetical protein K2W96_04830 [Gemmataceae bacterium]|nr:hypothetical protein [Gemmataceae bacterium]
MLLLLLFRVDLPPVAKVETRPLVRSVEDDALETVLEARTEERQERKLVYRRVVREVREPAMVYIAHPVTRWETRTVLRREKRIDTSPRNVLMPYAVETEGLETVLVPVRETVREVRLVAVPHEVERWVVGRTAREARVDIEDWVPRLLPNVFGDLGYDYSKRTETRPLPVLAGAMVKEKEYRLEPRLVVEERTRHEPRLVSVKRKETRYAALIDTSPREVEEVVPRQELVKVEDKEYRLEQRLVLKEEVSYEPRWETVTTRETVYRPVVRTVKKKREAVGVRVETTYEPGR